MKKIIQTQRVLSIEDAQREFKNVEDTINKLANATATGGVTGTPGPKGDTGAEGPAGAAGAAGADGAPGADGNTIMLPETVGFHVSSAHPGDWSVGSASIRKKAILFKISADQSCIVRLYFNSALRDSDTAAMRLPTTNPGPGIILAEVGLTLANGRAQFLAPTSVIYNADNPFTDTIYWAVQQTMAFDTDVNVSLYILPLEA